MTRFGALHLGERRRLPELMDDPALEAGRHLQALRGLERINRWSRSASILWPPIRDAASRMPGRSIRILDVATGAGDLPIALWRAARRHRVPLSVDGCDVSPRAIEHAKRRAGELGAEVGFLPLDVFSNNALPEGYDVVMSSLFLHHLDEAQGLHLLRRMREAAGRLVLVNDLVRSPLGLGLAYAGTRLLSASPVVRIDGVRSVRAAWTIEEVGAMAARAGLRGATVAPRWPCRFLLRWETT